MSLLKADTIKPITSGGDLSLQGDSGGSAVDCLNITSAGDVDFTGNADAKIKLPSSGGIYESDGTTPVLTESGGVVSLGSSVVTSSVGHVIQVVSTLHTDGASVAGAASNAFASFDTPFSKAITTSALNSKILILCHMAVSSDAGGIIGKLYRGETPTG